jgi:hypothetical protein
MQGKNEMSLIKQDANVTPGNILDGIEKGLRDALDNNIFMPDSVAESAKLFDIYTKLRKAEDERIRLQAETSAFEPYKHMEEAELDAMIQECLATLQHANREQPVFSEEMMLALSAISD